jgi:glucosamine--fructose-6-phosphate aminotransferase (isomerizing)
VQPLLGGLENLEYRGYDSAGLALHDGDGIQIFKREGDVTRLKSDVAETDPESTVGIGHTRWSTHGPPSDENAHPHTDCTEQIAVVHNGIIENHRELRHELESAGHAFTSETDTEVIPHLIERYLSEGQTTAEAFRQSVTDIEGSYAVAMVSSDDEAIYAARSGSPLVLGIGENEYFLASDAPAFIEYTDSVVYLEDGDVVTLTTDGYTITDAKGTAVQRPIQTIDWAPEDARKKGFDHYMLKEINEQPSAISRAIHNRCDTEAQSISLDEFPAGSFADVERVQFVACGTSYHAAMYGAQLLNERGVPAQVFRAAEYAACPAPGDESTLVVAVTQSGETADTLAAIERAAATGARTLAVTNVVGSSATRECDDALLIRAGPEIGVAATKTFTSQVAVLGLLTNRIVTDVGSESADAALIEALASLPEDIDQILDETNARAIAERYRGSRSHFFIGRGVSHPVALEGALKFKEITYEHAEGFAAGELKHGPLALVTDETPVFAIFSGQFMDKTISNVEEVRARGAPVIAVAGESATAASQVSDHVLTIPDTHPDVAGILANVQLQLVSYYVADMLDRSIDKPRNLAKSVTVE